MTVDITEDPKMMFAQYIDIENTFSEFTVDMYYDRQGRLKCAIPRERLEVRTGEVSKGATRRNALYEELVEKNGRIGRRTRLYYRAILRQQNRQHDLRCGNQPAFRRRLPVDLRRRRQLSGWLIQEYIGGQDIPFSNDWENNLIMLRYDAKVLVREHD